jgi:EmrB/QacA subfamily drug resistance transporter
MNLWEVKRLGKSEGMWSRWHLAYKWQVTLAVNLGMFLSLMDMTMVNVAIPQMQRRFGADIHAVQWVVTIYMLTQAAVIPTAPFLSARFGEKRAYVWTLIAFLLGSLLCGFAWNLPTLIFFRFIQGIGGGILLPLVMTLQYQAFPPAERGRASSAFSIPMTATVFGPVLGGYLVSAFGWQWAFLINVPLGIVAVVLAQKLLRPAPARPQARFDRAGFLTTAAGCAALVYAVSALTSGDSAFSNFLILLVGLLLLLAFVRIEWFKAQHGQQPLLDLRRFKDRTFALSSLALVFYSLVLFGLLFLIPIYLQSVQQKTPLEAGLMQIAQALANLLILPLSGRLSDKIGARPLALSGLLVMIATTLLMTMLAMQTPIWMVVGILILLGWGNGLAQQIPVSAMSRIEKEEPQEVANGSTLITVLRNVAAPLGVALFSSVVQLQSQMYLKQQALQPLPSELLTQQSTLLAMHDSFLLAAGLAATALVAMYFVPRRRKNRAEPPEYAPRKSKNREEEADDGVQSLAEPSSGEQHLLQPSR